MSNQAVGSVYQAIIDEVINSSRVDFEESGVEESVLEELRQVRRVLFVCRPLAVPGPEVAQRGEQGGCPTGDGHFLQRPCKSKPPWWCMIT
jgi:hypothetical protein